jgi:hypothetical protein
LTRRCDHGDEAVALELEEASVAVSIAVRRRWRLHERHNEEERRGEARLERRGDGSQLAGKSKDFGEKYRGHKGNIYSAQNY